MGCPVTNLRLTSNRARKHESNWDYQYVEKVDSTGIASGFVRHSETL
jgi:hypothetical protein